MIKKIKPYQNPAGGWGSLVATTRSVLRSKEPAANIRNLLRANQVKGFDCPGCAWGDQPGKHFSFVNILPPPCPTLKTLISGLNSPEAFT